MEVTPPQEVFPNIWKMANYNPSFTNTYLIKDDRLTLIDPGCTHCPDV